MTNYYYLADFKENKNNKLETIAGLYLGQKTIKKEK
jgi:hypothetical protein